MAENRKRFTEDFTSRILEVRYTDLEKEKRLCLELLVLAKEECDLYGEVFALAYMGDYYIAVSDMDRAEISPESPEDVSGGSGLGGASSGAYQSPRNLLRHVRG